MSFNRVYINFFAITTILLTSLIIQPRWANQDLQNQQNQEQYLMKTLMRYYESSVRPVKNYSNTLNIYFKMKLTQILELSEKDQTLITNIWVEQQWLDEFLMWNPENYSGIRSLRMPSNRIWLPDTFIYNSASSQEGTQTTINGPYAMLRYDGLVKFPVPMKLKSNCEVDIAYFPFDQQICYIKFASWIHDLQAINLSSFETNVQMRGIKASIAKNNRKEDEEFQTLLNRVDHNIDLSSYVDNSGWILLNVTFFRREKNHTTGIYPELIYFVHVKRRYLYYIFNVIIPCAMLSALTCMTFWLPCISGEKVTMGLTCFVAYSVFMLMVAEKVPATSETVPIISIYLTIVMSFTSISVIMAVIVTNIHERTKSCTTSKKHRLSKLLRYIFLEKIAKCLGMQKRSKELLKYMIKLDKREKEKKKESLGKESQQSANNIDKDKNLFQMIAQDFMLNYKKSGLKTKVKLSSSEISQDEHMDERYFSNKLKEKNIISLSEPSNCILLTDSKKSFENRSPVIRVRDENRFYQIRERFSKKDSSTEATTNFNFEINNQSRCQINMIGKEETKASHKHRKKKRAKYRFNKENIALYFAYEYVLFGLVLDRLFFWFFFFSTLLSYVITLYVFPFMMQADKVEFLKSVP